MNTTMTPTDAYDALRARTRWSPSWGFVYTGCPHCGYGDLIYYMRLCGHTHRPFARCDECGAIVGWAHDNDLAIRDQLRALGAPIERRAA